MYVADTKQLWREYAMANGIAHQETNEEGESTLVYNPGYHADHIGAMVVTPAVFDYSTDPPTLITEAVMDERFHVNLRVVGEDVEEEFIRSKRYKPLAEIGTQWVNPEDVSTPQRIWLGGMEYFSENIPDVPIANVSPPILNMTTASLGDLVSVATAGEWTGEPDLITYQWFRDSSPINQAFTSNHTVKLTDIGHTLTCHEIASNESGTVFAVSNECVVT